MSRLMSDEQAEAIQERAEKALPPKVIRASDGDGRWVHVCRLCRYSFDHGHADDCPSQDIPALLADRAERTRLLREVRKYSSHDIGCAGLRLKPCDCGLSELLTEMREAVR